MRHPPQTKTDVHRVTRRGRALRARPLALLTATLVAVSACGASEKVPSAATVVASVQDSQISQGQLEHWMHIENARLEGRSASVGVPDPPRYRHCVATAEALRTRRKRPPLSQGALRDRCAKVYRHVEDAALTFLITARWLEGEAAEEGVHAARSQAEATYRRLAEGPAGSSFVASLRREGMSRADEVRQIRLETLASKLRPKLEDASGHLSTAQVAAYHRRWRARTTCKRPYVVSDCRNG